MNAAAIRYSILMPSAEYPIRIAPDTEASPELITMKSCSRLNFFRYGLTTKGDSVWPMKILAVAHSETTRPVPTIARSPAPRILTTHCMIWRWYRTAIKDEMKMMIGRTCRTKTNPTPLPSSPNRKPVPALT